MKNRFLLLLFTAAALFTCCNKPDDNGNGSSTGVGQGSISFHWLYDIKDWIKDTDPELGYPEPVHFYSGKTNVKYVFNKSGSYTFTYVKLPSNTAMAENGSWSYDENNKMLSLIPASGSPYTFHMLALRDEHMNWGYCFTTYDAEGVPNGTAEEVVPLLGEK
jgi:hypothetical protein